MAPAGKFSHPESAVAVSLVLILLSVSASVERQCSWCGPLAEQVHRSQRAPPCDQPGETTCDAGLPHCAIVASSPPYVESRLCVKYYQDECYSIFCNSSRTWRMTCPCRGDFCNKDKTDREDEAFTFLARLGSKIQNLRIKKRTVTLSKFISLSANRTAIVNNETYKDGNTSDEVDKNLQSDKNDMTDISNNVMTSETEMKNSDDNMPNDKNNSVSVDEINTNSNQDSINREDDKMTPIINDSNKNENDDEATKRPIKVIVSNLPAVTEMSPIMTQRDPSAAPATSMETLRKDINMDVVNNIDHAAELSATEKSIEKTDIKPSMEMPTAEALQQNSSPSAVTQKTQMTTEQTPETTVMMATIENVHVTVTPGSDPMKMKKNDSVGIRLHNLLLFICTLLFFM